jgi:fatty acid desaturase
MPTETDFTIAEQEALDQKRTLGRLVSLPLAVAGMLMIRLDWPSAHAAVLVPQWLFAGYMIFCWSSCFHEAAHQTLWPSKRWSIWMGRALGVVLLIPYTTYRQTHIRHHAYLNRPNDWELWPYVDPGAALWFRRLFVWFDLALGMFASPIIYGRTFFNRCSPIPRGELRRAIQWEYAAMLLFWGAFPFVITIGATWSQTWPHFARAMLIPWLIAGMIQTGRKLTEHLVRQR